MVWDVGPVVPKDALEYYIEEETAEVGLDTEPDEIEDCTDKHWNKGSPRSKCCC